MRVKNLGVCVGRVVCWLSFFFFQAEDGIRDLTVTGVQTCALPISGVIEIAQAECAPLSHDRSAGDFTVSGRDDKVEIEYNHVSPEYFSVVGIPIARSEERRVGKECRSRWSPYH